MENNVHLQQDRKKRTPRRLEEEAEREGWKKMIIGGDFNARVAGRDELV